MVTYATLPSAAGLGFKQNLIGWSYSTTRVLRRICYILHGITPELGGTVFSSLEELVAFSFTIKMLRKIVI